MERRKDWVRISLIKSEGEVKLYPDQSATYTFNFSFPEQFWASITQRTASAEQTAQTSTTHTYEITATTTLTVQQDPIWNPKRYPLPTEYWTRPIQGKTPIGIYWALTGWEDPTSVGTMTSGKKTELHQTVPT